MRYLIYFLLVFAVGFSANAFTDCSTKAINKARAHSLQLSAKGKHKAAAEALSGLVAECSANDEQDDEEDPQKRAALLAWLSSDYALFLFKAGEYNKCIEAISYQTYPFSYNQDEKSNSAILNNFDKCVGARVKELGEPIKSEKCSIDSLKKDQMAVSLPAKLRKSDEDNACLTFEFDKKTKKKSSDDESEKKCPTLVRYSYSKKNGSIQKSGLSLQDKKSIINEPDSCCWIEDISFVTKESSILLLLGTTQPRQLCGGQGTMRGSELSTFSLKEKKLIQVDSIGIGYH